MRAYFFISWPRDMLKFFQAIYACKRYPYIKTVYAANVILSPVYYLRCIQNLVKNLR